MKKARHLIVFAVAVLVLVGIDTFRKDPVLEQDEAVLLEVVDGDTLRISFRGERDTVRFLGVDAPETREGEHQNRQVRKYGLKPSVIRQLGYRARDTVRETIGNQPLRLVFRQATLERDKYKRLLAYVEVGDEDTVDLGRLLLQQGLADTFRTTHPRESDYDRARRQAQQDDLALWESSR